MDLGTQTLLSVMLLLALNTAMVRMERLKDRTVLFFGVQTLNVLVALYLFVRGMPGFDHIPIVAWVLGLWLLLRVAANHRWWSARRRDDGRDEATERRASAIREALKDDQ